MSRLMQLNLIHLYTFYLAVMFLIGTMRRFQQYHDFARIALSAPGRWPRVLQQIKRHGFMFLTWATLRPAALALVLLLIQTICSRLIWPTAQITLHDLLEEWWLWPLILASGSAMIGVDGYFLIRVGNIDRNETMAYLDEAEHWLSSWKAPLIQMVTLGYIDPHKMVDTEVHKAMIEGKGILERALWWVSLQAGLRILFGLSLWLAWAFYPER
jgi:hypothetical protein